MAKLTPEGRRTRRGVFALTWTSYASYYFVRKNLPVAKTSLSAIGVSDSGLALLDTTFLTVYALGQFCGGWLGDRLGARRLVGFGMLLSAIFCALFGSSSTTSAFAIFLALDGFFEATGWPGTMKAMAAWYDTSERGKIMGLWSTCFQVGPILATALAARLIAVWGWRAAFFVPACVVALVGAIVLRSLKEKPLAEDLVDGAAAPGATAEEEAARHKRNALPDPAMVSAARKAALANPVVWMLGMSYFGMKLIRYCIDFWSPFFLERSLGYSRETAGYLSTALQVGGIVGAIGIGWISDRWFPTRRGLVAAVTTAVLALSLAIYAKTAAIGMVPNILGLALIGFCLFGPDALISGVAAQDLGGPYAAATVAGIINGMGSVGAIAQGYLFTNVNHRFGLQAVFYVLMILAAVSAIGLGAVALVQREQEKRAAASGAVLA
jgi:OPA family sugar phosphate sensor protein UhpC-like MFS transporter